MLYVESTVFTIPFFFHGPPNYTFCIIILYISYKVKQFFTFCVKCKYGIK